MKSGVYRAVYMKDRLIQSIQRIFIYQRFFAHFKRLSNGRFFLLDRNGLAQRFNILGFKGISKNHVICIFFYLESSIPVFMRNTF